MYICSTKSERGRESPLLLSVQNGAEREDTRVADAPAD